MLQNTSILQGLTVGGNTSLSKTEITGTTDINLTGSATTTIGGATTQLNSTTTTVGGTLGVTGATTLGVTGTGALTAASLSVTGNETVTGTLGVTGRTTLGNASCSSLGINKTIMSSSGTDPVMVVKPQEGSNQGALELGNKYGLYNVPYGQGTEVIDGGFTFRSNTSSGLPSTTLLQIQNTPANTSNNNTTSSVTNSASNIVILIGASLTNAAGVYTFTTTGDLGVLTTNIFPIRGVTYKTTFIVKSDTTNTSLYFDQNNSISLFDTTTLTNIYRTFVFYHTAINNNRLLIVVSSGGKRIQYTHLSVEPFYETTASSLSATSLGANIINANSVNNKIGPWYTYNDIGDQYPSFGASTVYGKYAIAQIAETTIINADNSNNTGSIDFKMSNVNTGVNINKDGKLSAPTINTNTIESTAVNSAMAIGGNITTETISIGASQTTGQINIGLLGTRIGDINIGNNIEGGILKIANNMSATSTGSIQAGTTKRGSHYYRGATVNICDDGGTINLGNSESEFRVYADNTYYEGPISGGSTNRNAMANFKGTSSYTTQIACRPYTSDTANIQEFYNTAGSVRGSIQGVSSSAVLYSTSSDRRLKINIKSLDPMLDKVMSLKPSKYNWKCETEIEGFGFVAQEVYDLFPQMRVRTPQMYGDINEPIDIEGNPIHYGLDYGQFTPYIVKALQEMKLDYDDKLAKLETTLTSTQATLASCQEAFTAVLLRLDALEQR